MLVLVVIVCALCALGFAAWPLLRRGVVSAAPHYDEAIKQLYRQRAVELEQEAPDEQLREELTQDMGAVLLTEADITERTGASTPQRANRALLWVLMVLIPTGALGLYYGVTDAGVASVQGAEAVLTLDAADAQAEIAAWREKLSRRVAATPDDSKSWYLLGHSYLKLGQYADAAEAFGTTANLAGDDQTVKIYWLQARYLAAQGVMDEVSHGLAEELLATNPNLSPVLELLALEAFRTGDGAAAITLLNRAISGAPDPVQQASFAQAIRQVREGLESAPPGVDVNVDATATVPLTASIFVIARPVGGGMPYAVVKRPAALVPFTVRLDDLVTMSPERVLSDTEEFEVLVRLSLSGAAMAQAGDWQWESAPLRLGGENQPVRLDATLTPP